MKTEQNFKFNKFAAKIAKKREITRKILARKQKRGNLTFLIRNKTLSRLDFKEQTKSGVCLKDISPREIQYGTPMARYSDKNFSSPTLKVNNENIDRTPKRMKVTRERKNELPPLHSTAEKKKDARLSQGQIHLKSFASFKNTSCNEKAPDSEIESKRDSELEESHRLEINNNFEKVSTATPSNTKTKTTKRNSVKVLIPLSRKKTHYTQTSSMNKTKKTNLPQLSVQSESNLTIKEGTLEKDSQEDSIIMLKDLMEKELTKAEKEIESFGKEFENLVESCRYTITQKYKKLACEISKNILNQDPELLINSTKHASRDTTELFSRLSACIQNCQRDSNNFEYQFNFFKNRLISVYNTVLYKMPNIDLNNYLSNFEQEQSRNSLRDMLQSMTGVVFENSVPLSEDNTQSSLSKLESMVNSLRLSKILESNEHKSDFAYKILIKNNYEKLIPLWGQMVEDPEDISAEEFHEHCDKQGPILILVKTTNDCIFGGVSPQGFDSINNYSGSEYAFLFSYATPTRREPIICKIKPEKASFAVKNNEAKYSPGFGQSNKSDLFISFKDLSKSYSHIGSVYEFPKELVKDEEGYNTPETFFTGLTTNWGIENIEVFSIGA